MNDLQIKEYEQGIVDAINAVEVPLEIKRLVVSSILYEINASLVQVLEMQKKEGDSDGEYSRPIETDSEC